MTASLGAVKAYGYAEAEQSVLTDVQPAVAIEQVHIPVYSLFLVFRQTEMTRIMIL